VNVLVIADTIPAPDRTSADFRFSQMLGMLAEKHDVDYCALGEKRQGETLGHERVERYRDMLRARSIEVVDGNIGHALRSRKYEAVVFEWHFPAREQIGHVRLWQPQAHIIIDSVDVVFNRLEAKAGVTSASADIEKARVTKAIELLLYERADVVVTVTDADAAILQRENPGLATFTIPNIHPLQEPVPIAADHRHQLIFVGNFARPGGETNSDAMLYFCAEILPLILEADPSVKLRIIGGSPPPEVMALASPHVEVLGFVPDTKPFLETSAISIAPLRFGGGMKGKIGEAMSFALPVVTTSVGIEGFGLEPARDALVGDHPRDFADAVIRLLRDPRYLDNVRMAGYQFIRDHYSDVAVRQRVDDLFSQLDRYPIKRLPMTSLWIGKAKDAWSRHVRWRFG
jgi:glycosyltransferase involved in cell wall biosynthesis